VILNYLNLYLQCALDITDIIIQGQNSARVILDYRPLILLKVSAAHHSDNAHNHATKIYQLNVHADMYSSENISTIHNSQSSVFQV